MSKTQKQNNKLSIQTERLPDVAEEPSEEADPLSELVSQDEAVSQQHQTGL